MNLTLMREKHINASSLDDLLQEGLITQQEADYVTDQFGCFLMEAIAVKGVATNKDVHPYPLSEMLRRFRKGMGQEKAGMAGGASPLP